MRRRLQLTSETGQTIPEYAVVLAGIVVILIPAILFAGGRVNMIVHKSAPDAQPTAALRPPSLTCDPHYSGACIPPPPPALGCADLQAMGITGEILVVGSDPLGLDPDGDGIACD